MKNLTDKVIAVTGAGDGIGRALVERLARERVRLAISDVNPETLEQTRSHIAAAGQHVHATVLDVSDRTAVAAWAAEVVATFGHVDMIVNNAGVTLGRVRAEDVGYDDFEWIMNVNLWGTVYCTKAFLPFLIQRDESAVVNVSSLFGLLAIAYQVPYCTSKFAVRGFTEALRMELLATHPHVKVVTVVPGGIRTSIARNSRWQEGISDEERERNIQQFEKFFRMSADKAADVIVRGLQRNSRRILIGRYTWVSDSLVRLFPARYITIAGRYLRRKTKS